MTAGTTDDTPDAAPPAQPGVFALLEVNGQRIGIDATAVVQVVPRPRSLASLPRASQTLAGVTSFRGRPVPVVNLALWRAGGPGAACETPPHIAILTDGAAWIGLLIDAVSGLARIAASDIQRLHHDNQPGEFFHSMATVGPQRELLGLLDAGLLMQQAQAWTAAAGERQAMAQRADAASLGESAGRFAVIRIGQRLYGVPATALAEVLPRPPLQAVLGSGSGLLGMLRWRERDVPLVDPMPPLGSPDSVDGAPWVAVVTDADHCIALPCHGMDQVRSFSRASVQPAASTQGLCTAACTGLVLQADGEQIRLVDPAALVRGFSVSAISLRGASAREGRSTQAAQRNREALVVFQARSRFAAPIHQLQEIVPLPTGFHAKVSADGRAGSVEWRGRAVPLIDLQRRLWPGAAPVTAPRRILITHLGDQLTALLVGEVEVLIPPHAGVQTEVRLPNGDRIGMVTVDQNDARASYRLIDLHALPLAA
ncbi:chemotaxis protein CheW [Hydrogenophaga sp. MI9]|uniref:chemotaxis protein CheW n=1 Tax=Hydrogenophaga sp. MI9 TaxID=3453719 RepID=UPI003EE85339